MKKVLFFCALVAIWGVWLSSCGEERSGEVAFSVANVMGEDERSALFARADTVRTFHFPDDHGAHPNFKTEWWYFTGNLYTDEGRRFGFQWTLFRFGFLPARLLPSRPSTFGAGGVMMGHFAISDIGEGKFHSFERFSRADNTIGGFSTPPPKVWLQDWYLTGTLDNLFPASLYAEEEGIALKLTIDTLKSFVLQGNSGLSRKGSGEGNASYYYSYPRLRAAGEVRIGGKAYAVQGLTWLDREWSTSALDEGQQGWDWFSLQFEDNTEVMCYTLRKKDGTHDTTSSAVFINADGKSRYFSFDEISLTPVRWHTMKESKTAYPIVWQLNLADSISIEVTAAMPEQEHRHAFRYWEGAVDARKKGVSGTGYVELTGY